MDIKGKVALITGSAKRIGRIIAIELAKKGANIAIHYKNSKNEAFRTLSDIKNLGVKAMVVKGDVTNFKEINVQTRKIISYFGHIDILINNASAYFKTPFDSLKEKDWDKIIDTNLKGPFLYSKAVSRFMKKQGYGKIINISDINGISPRLNYLPYCVSKAGLISLTKALAKELSPEIQVNAIAPGVILPSPDMTQREIKKIKKLGSPSDVVNAIIFLIESSDFMNGSTIAIDGGRTIV